MYAIGPKNYLAKLDESDLTELINCVHSWYGVDAIWYGAGVILQSHSMWFPCTLYTVQ